MTNAILVDHQVNVIFVLTVQFVQHRGRLVTEWRGLIGYGTYLRHNYQSFMYTLHPLPSTRSVSVSLSQGCRNCVSVAPFKPAW